MIALPLRPVTCLDCSAEFESVRPWAAKFCPKCKTKRKTARAYRRRREREQGLPPRRVTRPANVGLGVTPPVVLETPEPCDAMPGTLARMEEYTRRLQRGHELFVTGDRREFDTLPL